MCSLLHYYLCTDGQFGIQLDSRRLRTPLQKLFVVPYKALAVAIAHEWNSQGNIIQPSLMHLVMMVLFASFSCVGNHNNMPKHVLCRPHVNLSGSRPLLGEKRCDFLFLLLKDVHMSTRSFVLAAPVAQLNLISCVLSM